MSVSFTSDEYEDGFLPFAEGWANAVITDFGDDPNKAGTGEYIWFEFTVLDGVDKGRTLRQFYNYIHEKEDAQKIARGQLCAIARVVDVKELVLPDRARDFKDKKLSLFIKQKKGDDFPSVKEYDKYKSIETGFSDLEDEAPDPYAS